MRRKQSTPLPPLSSEEEDQLVKDAAYIGTPMLKAMRELAQEQNVPLWNLWEAAYQALLQIGHIALEERPADYFTSPKQE